MQRNANRPVKSHFVPYPVWTWQYLLASWGGSGRLRPAPGTWGTLAALPLWITLISYTNIYIYIIVLFAIFLAGAVAIEHIEQATGKDTYHDAGVFVVDEAVGMGIALLPVFLVPLSLVAVAAAFLFFRFFDVVKVWPASTIDRRWHSGWGVMLDDVVAGIYAAFCLFLSGLALGVLAIALIY